MLVAIFSDLHDNLPNLEKFLDWCRHENVQELICCGDVTNAETLAAVAKNYGLPANLIRGNMDIYEELEIEKYPSIKYLGRFGATEIDGKTVGLCHEPHFIDDVLKKTKCQIVFFGHTHKPWMEEKDGVLLVNPGTLSGVFHRACFAAWDTTTNKIDLKVLELI